MTNPFPVSSAMIANLLNESVASATIDVTKCENNYQLEEAVRELKSINKRLTSLVKYMLNKDENLEGDYFNNNLINRVIWNRNMITVLPESDYLCITATFDPRRFTNIKLVNIENQKKYFKKILSQLYIDNEFNNIYGCFELQLNGNVHFHGITRMYNSSHNIDNLKASFNRYLTFDIKNKYTTIVKPCTDIAGWLKYINDETKPGDDGVEKEYLEINI